MENQVFPKIPGTKRVFGVGGILTGSHLISSERLGKKMGPACAGAVGDAAGAALGRQQPRLHLGALAAGGGHLPVEACSELHHGGGAFAGIVPA